jgi:DNA helicase II / ATP-dependent DNA helicase PcrA
LATKEQKRSLIRKIVKGLNPAQKEAVIKTVKQPSLCIAGAGSGKTRVLQKRIAYILANGISPRKILAVTFTNKAAKEMKERIGKEIGDKKARMIMLGTFHSLAVRWLHQYYSEAGLKQNWTIFDDDDTKKLFKQILNDLNLDDSAQSIFAIKSVISNLKNAMVTPAQYRNQMTPDQRDTLRVYERYQDRLRRNNAVDFDDLIMKMVHVLENDATVRGKFQKRYKYIMVDEYQDTNECQFRMIKAIVGDKNNIFVVGDDYQSIYGWRGADVQKILNFQKDYPNTKIVKLEQNYRSTKKIVEAGNCIMTHNSNQMDKTCFTDNDDGDLIKKYVAPDDEAEARFIAEEIENLVTYDNRDYKDIAILYRTNVQSRLLEDQFMRLGVPYNMVSGFSFYERREIKDIMAWIQMSINPDNDLACDRIMQMQKGVGKTTIDAIKQKARSAGSSLYEQVEYFSPRTAKAKAAFVGFTDVVGRLNAIYEAGKSVSDNPITDMLTLIFKYTGYIEELSSSGKEEDERRIDNLRELQKIAKGYEEDQDDPNIQDFLDQVALQSKADKVEGADEVQMMTLHTSKGLEYPVVFLIGMEEGLFPHSRSASDPIQMEEERRLAYVGITRAQELLYVTCAQRRMGWDRQYKWNDPSRFLEEIPPHLLQEI